MDLAEPHPSHPDALVVRPETRFRVLVGAAAVGIIALCAAAGFVLADDQGSPAYVRILSWIGVIALIALVRTAGWHTLRSVRVDGDDLVLEHADRTLRRVPLAQVGGLGYRGTAIGGRLFDGVAFGGAVNAGRLVVVDRGGRLLVARRAGWMTFAELQHFCGRAGIAWVDHRSFLVPVVPVPPPTQLPVPVDPEAPADAAPAISTAIAAARRARRARLATYAGILGAGIVLCIIGAWLPEGQPPEGPVIAAGVIAILVGTVLLLVAPANEGRPRPMVKALRTSRWVFSEAVIAAGLDSDGNKRLLGVFAPDGRGAPVWWTKLGSGGGRGWLQDGERRWFWVAWDAKGRATAVATPEMDQFTLLPKEKVGGRQQRKATDAYLRACEQEYWNPDTPVGVDGAPLGLEPSGPHPGWGSAPAPTGATWGPPVAAPPAPQGPGTPPPGWVPPPAWEAPPAWQAGIEQPAPPGPRPF